MVREYIIITYLLTISGRWDELREFFALSREFLANTTHLSPEDQAKINEIYETATALKSKEDNAQK